jgi:hypothetical protein
MTSDISIQTGVAGSKPLNNHFVFILDESGSMGRSWQDLRTSYWKFVEPYRNDDTSKDLFSTILFDDSARIILPQRALAKDIQQLPVHL